MRGDKEESFPSIEEYHLTRFVRTILSAIRREINPTSPPGVHISSAEPVHD
jgi:hypothetical protein